MTESTTRESRLTSVQHVVTVIGKALSGVAGIGIIALCVLTLADVSGRYLRNRSVTGTIEVTEVGLVCVVFLGMMGAHINGRHIRTPLLTNRLPSRPAHIIRIIVMSLSVIFLLWATYETALIALDSISRGEYRYGIVKVPIWPARAMIPIGLAALAFAMALTIVETWLKLSRGESAEQVDVESNL